MGFLAEFAGAIAVLPVGTQQRRIAMVRRPQIRVGTDPVVAGCLAEIARGKVAAAFVLADYLDETGHGLAKRVRQAVRQAQQGALYCQKQPPDYWARPGRTTCWEAIGEEWQVLRWNIGIAFRRAWKWDSLTLEQLWCLNDDLVPRATPPA